MGYSKKEIAIIVLLSAAIIVVVSFLKGDPMIDNYLSVNRNIFISFIIAIVVLLLITGFFYHRTLDFVDEETSLTLKFSIVNIIIWCLFWVCWSVYNVVMLLNFSVTIKLLVVSFLLTIIPGILFFIYAVWSWREGLKDRMNLQDEKGNRFEGYEKLSKLTYFSGFYGIITIPVYLLTIAVYYIIN